MKVELVKRSYLSPYFMVLTARYSRTVIDAAEMLERYGREMRKNRIKEFIKIQKLIRINRML